MKRGRRKEMSWFASVFYYLLGVAAGLLTYLLSS